MTVEVDVNCGPAASYEGLRIALSALRDVGSGFGDIPERYAAEWAELFPVEGAARLGDIALAASERRLHRESEQIYRVLSVAAAALCAGSAELGRPVTLRGLGGTDLSSLRGFMRAVEHSALVPGSEFELVGAHLVRPPAGQHANYGEERARCLHRMGHPLAADDLVVGLTAGTALAEGEEADLYRAAMSQDSSSVDRIAAALVYLRRAFFSGNWEGMAIVAGAVVELTWNLSDRQVADVVGNANWQDGYAEAIEFETAILRTAADVRGFLLKALGIQASFRGKQDAAVDYFRAMRDSATDLSPEVRAQSHLFTALTLSKRKAQLAEAVAEIEQGFAAVQSGELDSIRRERGWLHNLRGLTLFAEKRLVAAFEHEKQALGCLEGLPDASSAHLRINLYSNISVLQEKAKKPEQALRTWDKFKEATGASNAGFVKHHSYRSAGLRLLTGDRDTALAELAITLDNAAELNDDFHDCEVRLELGTLHTSAGEHAEARAHFEQAETVAKRMGDPYRLAVAMAGIGRSADEIAEVAGRSLTQPAAAETLAKAVASGADVTELLPAPRTKLNRPFDLINFQD